MYVEKLEKHAKPMLVAREVVLYWPVYNSLRKGTLTA